MILTLLITIIVEGVVVTGYSTWRRKPIYPILLTSVCANLITQSFLWIVLIVFFQDYLMTLLIAELFIWMAESLILCSVPSTQLRFADAAVLSLSMNLMSFALGLVLPL